MRDEGNGQAGADVAEMQTRAGEGQEDGPDSRQDDAGRTTLGSRGTASLAAVPWTGGHGTSL
ncbi:hypothetical protein [Kribbella sancticallisti]|uniref:hypothetical protein n=1 Tax=Kribbella sancticallisti TaxID=460087 RepID=UPI0031D66464